ncbi:unnamed protein product [Gordionus sp. m RMFG-2023]
MDELIKVLSKFVSSDQNELRVAELFLQQAASNNLGGFLTELSNVISKPDLPVHIRMAAGLELKNHLTSKDISLKTQYHQRWLNMPCTIRNFIKQNVLLAISLEGARPSAAAQCAAYLAVAELPQNLWPELIPQLVLNITNNEMNTSSTEGSLEALGYICQEIDPRLLHSQSNEILTAIIHGMKNNDNTYVKLAATTALLNSLEFTNANFNHENERNYIMQVVCEATQSQDINIQVRALQCLVKIMSLYYEYMETYMRAALFAITLNAMKSSSEEVSLQGIEFWSTVCDEEIALSLSDTEQNPLQILSDQPLSKESPASIRVCKFYAKGALPFILPILTETLTKQDENADEDEWNPCKAGSVCLMLMSCCCGDEVVTPILPFVTTNIFNTRDWRARDASVMAFGCIMEGPSPDTLKPLVEQALPHIVPMLKDSVLLVRDTTSWTIGRICEFLPEIVLNPSILNPLLSALVENLSSEAKIAVNICWALSSLVEAAYDQALLNNPNAETPPTFLLSQQYEIILERLVLTSERNDGQHNNLKGASFQTIADFLKSCPVDQYNVLLKVTGLSLERLKHVILLSSQSNPNFNSSLNYNIGDSIQNQEGNQVQLLEMQSHLCSVLQSALRKIKAENLSQISDLLMASLLQMLSASGKTMGVQEDVLMTISALIEGYGDKFYKYMESFLPFLINSLKCSEETQVCIAAIMVVIDLYRSIGRNLLPYTESILGTMIQILADPSADKSTKPHIFSCLGDVALALGTSFSPFASPILSTLVQASSFKLSSEKASNDIIDEVMIDFVNTLRDSCVEAYTGIIHGLAGNTALNYQANDINQNSGGSIDESPLKLVEPYLGNVINFVETIAKDIESSETLLIHACSLIGDLCNTFGPKVQILIDTETLNKFFISMKNVKDKKHRASISWALRQIRLVKKCDINSIK